MARAARRASSPNGTPGGRKPRRAPYRLAPRLSFRTLPTFAVLVDHDRRDLLELNVAGGRVLERLERGVQRLSAAERAFAEQLVVAGLARRCGARSAAPPAAGSPPSPPSSEESADLLEALNRRTAEAQVPLHGQIELTYRCALGCAHCYLGPRAPSREPELSTAELARLLDELAALGCLFLQLTGGEPFARRDLEAIVGHARDRRFAVSLLTSGWGLRRALASRLAARGLDSVQVTLHGPDAQTHDAVTGAAGSFVAALGALRCWRDLGVRAQAAVTVTRDNLAGLTALTDLLDRERLGLHVACYLQPRRSGARDSQARMLGERGLRSALAGLPGQARPRLAGRSLRDPPCGAAANVIAIDPTGTVLPCHALRLPAGSIRQASLSDIWAQSPVLQRVRRVRIRDLADCPGCPWRAFCNRCTGSAVAEGLPIEGHVPFDCLQARSRAAIATQHAGGRRRREPSRL
jgi:PqqA peptide cyclase